MKLKKPSKDLAGISLDQCVADTGDEDSCQKAVDLYQKSYYVKQKKRNVRGDKITTETETGLMTAQAIAEIATSIKMYEIEAGMRPAKRGKKK